MHRTLLLALASFLAADLPAQLLGAPETFPLPSVASNAIAAADMDRDGRPDVAVLQVNQVAVLLADGRGGFRAPVVSPVPFPTLFLAQTLRLADANGDGYVDAWVGGFPESVILFGDGTGSLALGAVVPRGPLAIGDLDGDDDPDVITTLAFVGVVLWRNNGVGSFGAPTLLFPTIFPVQALAVDDLNGDGIADVVAASIFDGLLVAFGDGAGGFTTASQPLPLQVLTQSGGLQTADLDGDRAADLLIRGFSVSGGTDLYLLRNDGAGNFAAPVLLPAVGQGPLADVDGDGLLDIVAAGAGGLTVFAGDGDGGFQSTASLAGALSEQLALGDLDADGRVDVVGVQGSPAELFVVRNGLPTPAGVSSYGAGTPACAGTIGIWATPEPRLRTPDFRVLCSNAPRDQVGFLLLSRNQQLLGADPLGLGALLHVGPGIVVRPMTSDAGGTAIARLPIPQVPFLPGGRLYAQSVWFADAGRGDTCSTAALDLALSRGLEVLLQR